MYRDSDDCLGGGWFVAAFIVMFLTIGLAMASDALHAPTTIMDPYGKAIAVGEILMIALAIIGYIDTRRE